MGPCIEFLPNDSEKLYEPMGRLRGIGDMERAVPPQAAAYTYMSQLRDVPSDAETPPPFWHAVCPSSHDAGNSTSACVRRKTEVQGLPLLAV
ncbi:hypothetical protein MRX96_003747 [Rhipicephalus microplus]